MKKHWGKLVVGLVIAVMAGLYLFLDTRIVPQSWVRAFAEEVAYRAIWTGDYSPRETYAGANALPQPENHHVCPAGIISMDWTRMHVFSAARPLEGDVVADGWAWGAIDRAGLAARMKAEQSVQIIVLLKDDAVVDTATYFTFWGDLTALSLPQGFTPVSAVFTSYAVDKTYRIQPAYDVDNGHPPTRSCPHIEQAREE